MSSDHELHTVVDIDPSEFLNMSAFPAREEIHAFPQRVCLNDVAPSNICFMSVTATTSHLDKSELNALAPMNIKDIVVTFDTCHLPSSAAKALAPWNIRDMEVTFDTSHSERSAVKAFAVPNMWYILVTLDTSQLDKSALKERLPLNKLFVLEMLDTSHRPIGSCSVSQLPSGDSSRHLSIAFSRSVLDGGVNSVMERVWHESCFFYLPSEELQR